jgi:Fic family protein
MKKIITPRPVFASELTKQIIELEKYRKNYIYGSSLAWEFVELKQLFYLVEAVASARIEGNRTTVVEYILKDNGDTKKDDEYKEINNLLNTLNYVDKLIDKIVIDNHFIKEIQRLIVKNLGREGDKHAGSFRQINIKISGSKHIPPFWSDVLDCMDELSKYINETSNNYDDLLKIAVIHHRFVWIHPFENGNGRTARMLTYVMLCKKGFIIPNELRLYNPTAVFSNNRQKYYDMLELADDLTESNLLKWCEYFINSLHIDIKKVSVLTDKNYILTKIVRPAILNANNNGQLNNTDTNILLKISEIGIVKAHDILNAWNTRVSTATLYRKIRELKNKRLIKGTDNNARTYHLSFTNNTLTHFIIKELGTQKFLPPNM